MNLSVEVILLLFLHRGDDAAAARLGQRRPDLLAADGSGGNQRAGNLYPLKFGGDSGGLHPDG